MFRWLVWLWHWLPGLGLKVTLAIIAGVAVVIAIVAAAAIYWPGLFFTRLFEPDYPHDHISDLGGLASLTFWVGVGYVLHKAGVFRRIGELDARLRGRRKRLGSPIESAHADRHPTGYPTP